MRKIGMFLTMTGFFIAGWYAGSPAYTTVAGEAVFLGHPTAYVVIGNIIGDLRGTIRCPIAGVSLYWAPPSKLIYNNTGPSGSRRGWIVSSYGIEALSRMEPRRAHAVAQEAMEKVGKFERLVYPLRPF